MKKYPENVSLQSTKALLLILFEVIISYFAVI
jgi:hypothetical protein